MPAASSDSVRLHHEVTGSGPPVLLVMGLGMNATGWWRTIPALADDFTVIAFDNRGVGRSERPPGPYTVAQMADDAMAVLDAAGHDSAHVYGISLGGMIAQEIVLRHPARVQTLVLGATTPGGALHVPPPEATLAFLERRAQMPAVEAVWASVPYSYAAATRRDHAERIGQDIEQRLRFPIEPEPYVAQLAAAVAHDAGDRLGAIDCPTLVVHGDEDNLVVPENGHTLAAAIPGAELMLLSGAAHLYVTDVPDADRRIGEWISAQSSPDPS
jgi:pimeloyl-ACP methyl ester carboxylesterase